MPGRSTRRRDRNALRPEPHESAREAGLRYVSDRQPGIRRIRSGRGFRYVDPEGRPLQDAEARARIRSLAIPPAWREVWISPTPRGHLQATGRDSRGRKQYRYHPRWRAVRDETKFGRMVDFCEALPAVRARLEEDLRLRGLPRRKVLAAVVRLLETTLIRVGNAEYARDNRSFGLTTLRDRHVDVEGAGLRFVFNGKSGRPHAVGLKDRRLARIVRQCRDLPGYELFQYLDERGERHTIGSADVNDYLREISGRDFTAKDFRTWAGTVAAVRLLRSLDPCESGAEANRVVVRAVKEIAGQLGNTPAVCRKYYIHPSVLDRYLDGSLRTCFDRLARRRNRPAAAGLTPEEQLVLEFLREQARHAAA